MSDYTPKKLTIDEIKKTKSLENLTDDEALQTIDALEVLATVIYSIYNSKVLNNEKFFDEV